MTAHRGERRTDPDAAVAHEMALEQRIEALEAELAKATARLKEYESRYPSPPECMHREDVPSTDENYPASKGYVQCADCGELGTITPCGICSHRICVCAETGMR